ncbi:hypothetical protein EBR25_06785 [bacterium]|nr:hypothetical protein [bacterium]
MLRCYQLVSDSQPSSDERFSKRSTESGFQGFQERVSVSEWSSVSFVITLSMDLKSILIGSQHSNEKA